MARPHLWLLPLLVVGCTGPKAAQEPPGPLTMASTAPECLEETGEPDMVGSCEGCWETNFDFRPSTYVPPPPPFMRDKD